jgi:4-hydroxybenzoate polyprenyltransferase
LNELRIDQTHITEVRKYLLLSVAALALFLTGVVSPTAEQTSTISLFLLIWGCVSGVVIVYRFNDYANKQQSPWKNTMAFFLNPTNTFVVLQFFLFGIPLSAVYLSTFQFKLLAIAGITGIFYAVNFKLGSFTWMAKHLPVVKNLLIGVVWGMLFIIGYGTLDGPYALGMFLFISVQVFIGSAIRDLNDIENDQKKQLNTLAVILPTNQALVLLHLINIISFGLFLLFDDLSFTLFLFPVIWRIMNLYFIQQQGIRWIWTQVVNLMTCLIILLTTIAVSYGTYS